MVFNNKPDFHFEDKVILEEESNVRPPMILKYNQDQPPPTITSSPLQVFVHHFRRIRQVECPILQPPLSSAVSTGCAAAAASPPLVGVGLLLRFRRNSKSLPTTPTITRYSLASRFAVSFILFQPSLIRSKIWDLESWEIFAAVQHLVIWAFSHDLGIEDLENLEALINTVEVVLDELGKDSLSSELKSTSNLLVSFSKFSSPPIGVLGRSANFKCTRDNSQSLKQGTSPLTSLEDFPALKSSRPPSPDVIVQGLQLLKASLKSMSVKVIEVSRVDADDVIVT
ncbi:DNA polymerase I [Cucumis melo var. makuwa]|uniref:DNA polymerase I n=1 Tax=Cucumis melo var. makuwa TaxID=1194695 RepID=A0A5A7UI01_CUCMM|nr:DNA polymerase I [Cucumis melo var. makuwa]